MRELGHHSKERYPDAHLLAFQVSEMALELGRLLASHDRRFMEDLDAWSNPT